MIGIDFTKAKEITKNKLRTERVDLFAKLDLQSQINMEQGKDNSSVLAEKERLRDITKLPDQCSTVEELKALTCTLTLEV